MLGVLAAVALLVGAVGTTVTIVQNNEQGAEQAREPVVEVQAVESVRTK
jgi:adenylate kinase